MLAKPNDCFINIYKSDTIFLSFLSLSGYTLLGDSFFLFPVAPLTFCGIGEGIWNLTFFFDVLACTLGVFVKKLHSEVFKGGPPEVALLFTCAQTKLKPLSQHLSSFSEERTHLVYSFINRDFLLVGTMSFAHPKKHEK